LRIFSFIIHYSSDAERDSATAECHLVAAERRSAAAKSYLAVAEYQPTRAKRHSAIAEYHLASAEWHSAEAKRYSAGAKPALTRQKSRLNHSAVNLQQLYFDNSKKKPIIFSCGEEIFFR
jgi:hypothetical protein